jgi:hypothetical protein
LAFCEKNLFAGTTGDGVLLFPGNMGGGNSINIGLADTSVNSIAVNNLNIFAGTHGSGLWKRTFADILNFGINPDTIILKQFQNSYDSLYIISDLSWTIEGQTVNWLTLNKTEGTGNDVVVVHTTQANPNNWRRSALFLLTSSKTGTKPFYVIQLEKTAGILEQHADFIKIFPNPTCGILTIKSQIAAESASVINSSGALIREKQGQFKEVDFDLSGEPDGIYYIHIQGTDWSNYCKVILIK